MINNVVNSVQTGQINNYFDSIISLLPSHIFWKDTNGVYLGCNQLHAINAGFSSPNKLIGKTDHDMAWKGAADTLRQIDHHVIETGNTVTLEEVGVLANGVKSTFLTQKISLKNNQNEIIGILGVSVDITPQKTAEQREKVALSAKAKAEEETRQAVMILAGSMAHDMRTPLASLNILASQLDDMIGKLVENFNIICHDGLPAEIQDSLRRIKMYADAPQYMNVTVSEMNNFINDSLKALSRVLTGNVTSDDLVVCSLEYCVSNALQRYPYASDELCLTHWDHNYDFEFYGNPVLFFRIIFNLIKNALYQIHKNGKGQIYLSACDGGEVNIFKVRDTAGSVSQQDIAHFFDGYQSNKKQDFGIGLAFCKLTMQSFGGDISCHGVEHEYVEFELRFPKVPKK